MARIQMNNTVALTNYIESKRRNLLRSFASADENGEEEDGDEDDKLSDNLLQLQHNHLLSCLEQATVSNAIGVGDGGKGSTCPPTKIRRKKYFLAHYYVKFGHFSDKSCKIREFC